MKTRNTTLAICVCLFASAAFAGDLNPPAGAPQSTMKTLDEVESRTPIDQLPFTINQPGSYFLTRDLTATGVNDYIIVAASDVAIDFRGFTIDGANAADFGVFASGSHTNLFMRDGVIRDCAGPGANVRSINECVVERMHFYDNNGDGLSVGFASVVRECHARSNDEGGIVGRLGTEIHNSIAAFNGYSGIVVDAEGLVAGCTSRGNGDDAVLLASEVERGSLTFLGDGIAVGDDSRVERSVATGNAQHGIETFQRCTIQLCVASDNNLSGIAAGDRSVVTQCATRNNGQNPPPQTGIPQVPEDIELYAGVCAGAATSISQCAAMDNVGGGVVTLENSTIERCAAARNGDIALLSVPAARGFIDPEIFIRILAVTSGVTTAGDGGVINQCVAGQNVVGGVLGHTGASLAESVARANGTDTMAPQSAMRGGSTQPFVGEGFIGLGISAGEGSVVHRCAAVSNLGVGVTLGVCASITDSLACDNELSGFDLVDGGSAIRCLAYENGASIPPTTNASAERGAPDYAGFFVNLKRDLRIESCHSAQNNQGYAITGDHIVLIKNSSYDNGVGSDDGFFFGLNCSIVGGTQTILIGADNHDNFELDTP